MSRYIDIDKVDFMMADGDAEFNKGVTKCIQILNNAPTEDVRPVVRGKWIEHSLGFKKCSVCGAIWDYQIYRNPFCNYCPSCGCEIENESPF